MVDTERPTSGSSFSFHSLKLIRENFQPVWYYAYKCFFSAYTIILGFDQKSDVWTCHVAGVILCMIVNCTLTSILWVTCGFPLRCQIVIFLSICYLSLGSPEIGVGLLWVYLNSIFHNWLFRLLLTCLTVRTYVIRNLKNIIVENTPFTFLGWVR